MAAQGEGGVAEADGDRLATGDAAGDYAHCLAGHKAYLSEPKDELLFFLSAWTLEIQHCCPLINRQLIQAKRNMHSPRG